MIHTYMVSVDDSYMRHGPAYIKDRIKNALAPIDYHARVTYLEEPKWIQGWAEEVEKVEFYEGRIDL